MRDDLTFLHGGHTPRCIASVDKRFVYYTLQFMTRGGVELVYDDDRHELRRAAMWSCFPGPTIRFHESPRGQPWEHRYIAFAGPRVAAWESQGLWFRTPEHVEAADVKRLARWMDHCIAEAKRTGPLSRLAAINALERILIDRAARRQRQASDRPVWLDPILDRLADVEAPEPDYRDLAADHNLALTTLRRRFRDAIGRSLHDYRLDCRIAAARRLLGDTDTPIKAVAEQLGYRDVFYFSRQFRQRVGVAPAAYRRSRQG